MGRISALKATRILDSRGKWTVETTVSLDEGTITRAAVPAGHSIGSHEAKLVEPAYAVEKINTYISQKLIGKDVTDQKAIDDLLIDLDGTEDKSNLGANTILSVSLSLFKAAAASQNINLYDYISQHYGFPKPSLDNFPTPLLNLLNGGMHATNELDFQSFMVAPGTFMGYSKGLDMGVKVYHKLKEILSFRNLGIDVGEEGGFSPRGIDSVKACHFIVEAIRELAYRPGAEMFLAIDAAASTFYTPPNYQSKGTMRNITPSELMEKYLNLIRTFPLIFLEDPFAEDSWQEWANLTSQVKKEVNVVGDDLTVTNPERLKQAIEKEAITGVIIKPDQIGTLTETIDVIKIAKEDNITVVISHRSGETAEDTFISDLAVGVGATYIKAGAPARGERTSKYNRLLEIEGELSSNTDQPQRHTNEGPVSPSPKAEPKQQDLSPYPGLVGKKEEKVIT